MEPAIAGLAIAGDGVAVSESLIASGSFRNFATSPTICMPVTD